MNGHEGRRKGFKKDGTKREKRAPTAYNKFMAEKMGELKVPCSPVLRIRYQFAAV